MTPMQTVAVQARTEARDASGTDPNDLELEFTPQARWDVIWQHGNGHFTAVYAPRLVYSIINADASQDLAAKNSFLNLHQVSIGTEIEQQRYHVAAYGNFAYGPITTTALLVTKPWLGEGLPPPPGVIIPAKFGAEFTVLFGQGQVGVPIYLTRRLTLIPLVAYNAFGGADSASRDVIAMVRGPGASLSLEAKATREDTFKTKIGAGQAQAFFGGDRVGASFVRAEAEERLTHKFSELTTSELAGGVSFSQDQFTGARLFPTAEANSITGVRWRTTEVRFGGVARVQPWLDPLSGDLEQRVEIMAALNVTFWQKLVLRAQGGYARVLEDTTVVSPNSYSIGTGEGGIIYKFTRELSADATLRFSRQDFSNAYRAGVTNQWLGTVGLLYQPHDWKL
jgi:hypothetical protein